MFLFLVLTPPVTLILTLLSSSHFGSYTFVIPSLWFLNSCHPVTSVLTRLSYIHFSSYTSNTHLGSYTMVNTSVLTPLFSGLTPSSLRFINRWFLFYSSYTVYHFMLWFLQQLSFHFTVLTPFVISIYDSYNDVISFGFYTIITTLGSYPAFLANDDLFRIGSYTDDD